MSGLIHLDICEMFMLSNPNSQEEEETLKQNNLLRYLIEHRSTPCSLCSLWRQTNSLLEGNAIESEQSGDQQAAIPSTAGWREMVEVQYRKVKENAETYPYIRASYIVVCGGYGHWMTYRWGKLRRTESRIQALQEKLQKLVEAEKSAAASASSYSEKATELPLSAWSVVTAHPAASKAPKHDKF